MPEKYCEFCRLLLEVSQPIIAQNDSLFAFYDLNKTSAVQHILVCTKAHIESALEVEDPNILVEMRDFGEKVLKQIAKERGVDQNFRFGFHLPPFTSVDHIHLHGFILPFSKLMFDKMTYGKLLKSVEQAGRMSKYGKL